MRNYTSLIWAVAAIGPCQAFQPFAMGPSRPHVTLTPHGKLERNTLPTKQRAHHTSTSKLVLPLPTLSLDMINGMEMRILAASALFLGLVSLMGSDKKAEGSATSTPDAVTEPLQEDIAKEVVIEPKGAVSETANNESQMLDEQKKQSVFEDAVLTAAAELSAEMEKAKSEQVATSTAMLGEVSTPEMVDSPGSSVGVGYPTAEPLIEEPLIDTSTEEPLIDKEEETLSVLPSTSSSVGVQPAVEDDPTPVQPVWQSSKLAFSSPSQQSSASSSQEEEEESETRQLDDLRQYLQEKASQQTIKRMSQAPTYLDSLQTNSLQRQETANAVAVVDELQDDTTSTTSVVETDQEEPEPLESSQQLEEQDESKNRVSPSIRRILKKRALLVGAVAFVLGRRLLLTWTGRGMM